jgi:hypothetical protein
MLRKTWRISTIIPFISIHDNLHSKDGGRYQCFREMLISTYKSTQNHNPEDKHQHFLSRCCMWTSNGQWSNYKCIVTTPFMPRHPSDMKACIMLDMIQIPWGTKDATMHLLTYMWILPVKGMHFCTAHLCCYYFLSNPHINTYDHNSLRFSNILCFWRVSNIYPEYGTEETKLVIKWFKEQINVVHDGYEVPLFQNILLQNTTPSWKRYISAWCTKN